MYFERFVKERNIKNETIKGYKSTINRYEEYYQTSIDDLIQEAIDEEENPEISKRQRSIKSRLLNFRTYLVTETDLKVSTIRNHMKKLNTLYKQFDVEVPDLPSLKDSDSIETTYFDLPTREQIGRAVEMAGIRLGSMILFMASSGTGRKECANMTIGDFLEGCEEYYTKETLPEIVEELSHSLTPIVPTLYLLRVKTQKKYYTFCTPEASDAILEWLILRLEMCEEKGEELTFEDSLWGLNPRQIAYHFQHINDELEFGFKEGYRFLRPHSLRKFNASNIGLSQENIDLIQGRSKDALHATYIKTNPEKLKKTYMAVMENVTIGKASKKEIIHEDFTINLNLNFYGAEYGISL